MGADTRPLPPPAAAAATAFQAWSTADVAGWLVRCGLEELTQVFMDNEVDGAMLADWTQRGDVATKASLQVSLPANPIGYAPAYRIGE